jgi:hypothetical protein
VSHLVLELGLTLDRIAVLAPTRSLSGQLFEDLTTDLTTDLGRGQNLDLSVCSFKTGKLASWASFTMGIRGKLQCRVALVGLSFADALASPALLESVDALLFWTPTHQSESDELFQLKASRRVAQLPCFAIGLNHRANEKGTEELRRLALREWFRRSFAKPQFLENSSAFLREGMEEILGT